MLGTPDELKISFGSDWLDITLRLGTEISNVVPIVQQVAAGELHLDVAAHRISVPVKERTRALVTVATAFPRLGLNRRTCLRRPTLDEVFIHLTGTTKADQTLEGAS